MTQTQLVHIRLPSILLQHTDELVARYSITRSEFIRQAIVEKIQPPKPKETTGILLLTDRQLEDLQRAIIVERRRRSESRR